MFRVGHAIRDRYNRIFIVVEKVQKTGANGELYTLYNLYPPTIDYNTTLFDSDAAEWEYTRERNAGTAPEDDEIIPLF